MPPSHEYFRLTWPANPTIPAAIAAVESQGDPFAISDSGLAWGYFQMHPDFLATYWPAFQSGKLSTLHPDVRQVILQLGHWSPIVWSETLMSFLSRHQRQGVSLAATLRIFHYGHDEVADPDDYVAKCAVHLVHGSDGWNL